MLIPFFKKVFRIYLQQGYYHEYSTLDECSLKGRDNLRKNLFEPICQTFSYNIVGDIAKTKGLQWLTIFGLAILGAKVIYSYLILLTCDWSEKGCTILQVDLPTVYR